MIIDNIAQSSGKNGITPHIGANGNWWIDDVDTGVCAGGSGLGTSNFKYTITLLAGNWTDGTQTITHEDIVKDNCHYIIAPTAPSADVYTACQVRASSVAVDGEITFTCENVPVADLTVNVIQMKLNTGSDIMGAIDIHIGENGHWFIGEEDTGVKARGEDGVTPTIGDNGNWWIGDDDTGVKARGEDGKTPVKGEDYFTEADKAEMVDAVIAAGGGGGSATIKVNGILKGDGTGAVSAAVPGTDYAEVGHTHTQYAPTSHTQAASTISAGTFAGEVKAKSASQTYSTYLLRNSRLSTESLIPTHNGEIVWIYG